MTRPEVFRINVMLTEISFLDCVFPYVCNLYHIFGVTEVVAFQYLVTDINQ